MKFGSGSSPGHYLCECQVIASLITLEGKQRIFFLRFHRALCTSKFVAPAVKCDLSANEGHASFPQLNHPLVSASRGSLAHFFLVFTAAGTGKSLGEPLWVSIDLWPRPEVCISPGVFSLHGHKRVWTVALRHHWHSVQPPDQEPLIGVCGLWCVCVSHTHTTADQSPQSLGLGPVHAPVFQSWVTRCLQSTH